MRKDVGIKDVIQHCFGFSSKKIVSLVCGKIKDSGLNVLNKGPVFRGLLPLDVFYPIIEAGNAFKIERGMKKMQAMRNFFKVLELKKRISLIKEMLSLGQFYIYDDVFRLYNRIKENSGGENINISGSWKEIHDFLMKREREIQFANKEIKYPKEFECIDGMVLGDLRLELPRMSWDLNTYTEKLGHCISSYADMAVKSVYKLFAVYKNDELLYNGDIRMDYLNQLRAASTRRQKTSTRNLLLTS